MASGGTISTTKSSHPNKTGGTGPRRAPRLRAPTSVARSRKAGHADETLSVLASGVLPARLCGGHLPGKRPMLGLSCPKTFPGRQRESAHPRSCGHSPKYSVAGTRNFSVSWWRPTMMPTKRYLGWAAWALVAVAVVSAGCGSSRPDRRSIPRPPRPGPSSRRKPESPTDATSPPWRSTMAP